METIKPALKVSGLCKRFNGIKALDKLSFTIFQPETIALIFIGSNGAGKSTAVNTLTGLYPPDEGYVSFYGKNITRMRMDQIARLGIIRTFQKTRLFNELSVFENLCVGAVATIRSDKKQISDEAIYWLQKLGLQDVAKFRAKTLPYGYRRFVEIGRAMMAKPKLLILDEPGAGMSEEEQKKLVKLLQEIKSKGITMVIVEHIAWIIFELATKIILLDQGRKIYEGPPTGMASSQEVQQVYYGGIIKHVNECTKS